MKFKIIFLIVFLITVSSLGIVNANDISNSTLDNCDVLQTDEITEIEVETYNGHQKELVENEDYEIYVGDIVSIEKMPKDAEGNITISVDDIERYNRKVSVGGNAIFMEDLNLDYGIHPITLKYSGDNKYEGFIKNTSYENSFINVMDSYGRIDMWGAYGSISVALKNKVTGNIQFLLDNEVIFDKKYISTNQRDTYSDYDIEIAFEGYHTSYEVRYFKGNQKDSTIKGNISWNFDCYFPDEVKYGESAQFKVSIPTDGHGIAKFKNTTHLLEYAVGDYSHFNISDLDIGQNTIEITVYVNNSTIRENYSIMVLPFTAPKWLQVGEVKNLIFNASHDFNGYLTLSGMVNGTFKVINGSAIIPISSENVGYNMLNITYENCTWTCEIEVNDNANLIVSTLDIVYPWSWAYDDGDSGPGVDIWLFAYDSEHDLTGNTTIYLNDKMICQHKGTFSYRINPETLWQSYEGPRYYTVKAVYSGDEYYKPRTDYNTFYMSTYSWLVDGNNLIIELPCKAKGTLTVKFNNKTYSKKIVAATYNSYPGYEEHEFNLNDIKYPIKVSFNGTPSIYSFNLSIDGPAEIFEYHRDINYGESTQFKINNKSNATLVLYLNGANVGTRLPVYEVDLRNVDHFTIDKNFIDNVLKSKMVVKYIFDNAQTWGDYQLMLTPLVYSDEGIADLYSIFINFNPTVTGAKSINMYYGDSKTLTLKVYDFVGKIMGKNQVVKIQIGKKTFSAKADKNGKITFKIPNTIVPGSYSMKITYESFSIKKTIKVKQILSLKTVKVKKSAKKIILTAILKKGKTPLKNKRITFKFNGKTFKATTNKKGIAKVTIKKTFLKKLKVGKKVTYKATYLKNTVKKTVKVKK